MAETELSARGESPFRRRNRLKRAGRRQGASLLYGTALLFVAMSGRTAYVHGARSIFMGVAEARAANEQRRLTATAAAVPTACPTPEPTRFADTGGEGFLWKDALVNEPYAKAGSSGVMIIFHILGVCWMFIALMLVCDNFFCPALEEMVEKWQIKEDVAGATFMAAGGSAPELFTSIIGVFFAESDVGFGTIVGSAVFNVLFVIGLCAVATGAPMPLTWWPLFRDCTYYIIGLTVLAVFVFDQKVWWWEALILFLLYVGYVTIMYFNERLEAYVKAKLGKGGAQVAPGAGGEKAELDKPTDSEAKYLDDAAAKLAAGGDGEKGVALDPEEGKEGGDGETEKKEGEGEEEEDDDPWKWPDAPGERVLFVAAFPLKLMLYGTLPDCSKDEKKHLFLVTFFASLIWIALFSYFMVWWATIIGAVVGITPVVMGLTFLAAGTSIPDALSSVYMAKMGEGDMAISSSIGSNVFDILVGLPIPWLLKCLTASAKPVPKGDGAAFPNFTISVESPFVIVDVILLLFMVCVVVVSIAKLGWKLDMRLGGVMGGLYFVFLICAIMLETNYEQAVKTNGKDGSWVESFMWGIDPPWGGDDDDGCSQQ